MMKIAPIVRKLIFVLISLVSVSGSASAQESCETYTVKDGDTLGSISLSAYGTYDYQKIFNANRDVLKSNPNALLGGTQLVLPCPDGRLTADVALGTIIKVEEEKQENAVESDDGAYRPPVKILTSNGWAAFANKEVTGGGMFVRLATTALRRAGNKMDYEVSYVDDAGSHIDTLLPDAFDVGVAWDIEDCSSADLLPDLARSLCLEYEFSDPIYEIVYGYATLNDNKYAGAKSYADFAGARMCRPEAWASSDLIRNGLVEPSVSWTRPGDFEKCYKLLLAGEVDVYAMDVEYIADNMKTLGGGDRVLINERLSEFIPQGFVVHKTNERGLTYLKAINAGLEEMRETGEWYDIVSSTLEEYNAKGN